MTHGSLRSLLAASALAAAVGCSGSIGSTSDRESGTSGDRSPTGNASGGNGSGGPSSPVAGTGGPTGPGTPTPGGTPAGGTGAPGLMPAPIGSAPPAPSACKSNLPGPRVLRRLTATQYVATLHDLFKGTSVPSTLVMNDPEVLGFHSDADRLVVQDLGAQQLMDDAEAIAHWATMYKTTQVSPCQTNDSACRQQFIKSFGRRAFRQPLSDAQVKAYEGLFPPDGTFADGFEAVVTAMLQSPYFLYRRELGTPDVANAGRFQLTPFEVASELSYLLTGSMPDAELSAAADAGMLSTAAQIDAQAERLLKDARAQDQVMEFVKGWLELDRLYTLVKDDNVFKLTDAVRSDMVNETRGLVLDVFKRDAPLGELFSANYTFVTSKMAMFYGLPGASDQPTKVTFSGQRDPGILGHASLLTGHATASTSSPVKRGKLVRTRLLCQTLPDPPGDVDTMLKQPEGVVTTRQRFMQHSQSPACAGCHKLIDPVGFAFEQYDAFGRRRDKDNGLPVDASGMLSGTKDGDITLGGLKDLEAYLAKSDDVRNCAVRYWSYAAYGMAAWPEDACTQESIQKDAAKGQFTLKSIVMGILHAPHFTSRVQDR